MSISSYLNDELVKTLLINKINPEDYRPAYNGESVGLDLWYTGSEPFRTLLSVSKNLIPTGLHICLPRGYAGLLLERGSVTKGAYKLRAGVIDPGYTDQIFVNLVSLDSKPVVIEPHSKLPVQLIIVPVLTHTMVFNSKEVYEHNCEQVRSARNTNKLGSSD